MSTALALAALLLLPGLLVVRAPWTVVPALSLAFWAVSIAWPPVAGLSRSRFVSAVLIASATLAVLRIVPKHEVPPPPGWEPTPTAAPPRAHGLRPPPLASLASWLVLAGAAALVAPALLWHHAPGPAMAYHTTATRLVLWRDGLPLSAEPLLPLWPFGAHAPAMATLSADLSQLSGLSPARSVLLLLLTGVALLLLGQFALASVWLRPRAAAVAAACGLALAPWPGWLSVFGASEAVLCLAFLSPALALLLRHASRASAVASGLLGAASLLAQPVLALGAWMACGVWMALSRRPLGRWLAGGALAMCLALPGSSPALQALSGREARLVFGAVDGGLAVTFLIGFASVTIAIWVFGHLSGVAAPRRFVVLFVTAAALLSVRVHGWIARGQLSVDARAAIEQIAEEGRAQDRACAPAGLAEWVPALAARSVRGSDLWMPLVYRDEWERRSVEAPCSAPAPRK